MRPSWVEIDLDAVAANVAAFGALGTAAVWAVVKADGYGHGDVPVAEAALAAGAGGLCVALVEEGVRLREAGIEAPVLLLSEPPASDLAEVLHWRITPTVYTTRTLARLEALAAEPPVGVHVKVDTGMHRVGADPDSAHEIVARLASVPGRLGGVWTHFAVADSDPEFTAGQIDAFNVFCRPLAAAGIDLGVRHLANTAGAILHPEGRADLVRIGLGMYGLHPSLRTAGLLDLRPALRLVSHVSHVRRYPARTRLSYGRRRPLATESTVVTIPVGYADGVPRRLGEAGGEVLIGGRRHPLAGTVTMDQIVVDVGDCAVDVDDEVVLLGRQGSAEIPVDEWAGKVGTISYEIVCGLGRRLPRRYREQE